MDYKYYRASHEKTPYLWVRLLDKNGKIVKDLGQQGCHGILNRVGGLTENTATINVYRHKRYMPYDVKEVVRWISYLNEMGFPCEVKYNDDALTDERKQINWADKTIKSGHGDMGLVLLRHGGNPPVDPTQFYNFYVHLKDYANKSHLFSTLQLMRVLYEMSLNLIPEQFFTRVEKDPSTDKFQLLQDLHKSSNGYSHAITYNGNGKNITRDFLMERFKVKEDFHTAPLHIYKSWNGD